MTDAVCSPWEAKTPPKIWFAILGIALSLLLMLGGCIGHLLLKGVGVWGNNNPVYWGWPIVNFVFWVGIGHAGTLISAILFLFRQDWRTSINRAAEAMTIFAVVCAGMFPGIHIGRVWVFYWLFRFRQSIWRCGRISAAPCCGTCSRFRLTQLCLFCSGTWEWSPIWRRSVTVPNQRLAKWFTAYCR